MRSLVVETRDNISKGIVTPMEFSQLCDDFEFLDDWEDRYKYLIELGRKIPTMPEEMKTEATKVRGCASQVWLTTNIENGKFHFQGDSDAHIVRGLIAVLFSIFQDKSASEILETDALAAFTKLGLKEHLTPQRSNGFAAMVERIRSDARAQLENQAVPQ